MIRTLRRWGWLFAGPTFLAFLVGFIVPFALGIYLSFTKFTTVTDSTWVGLENYSKILGDEVFVHSLWYTVAFTIVTTVIINVAAFAVAYMLTKAIKGRNLFRGVFFMPNLIGGIILGYVWLLLLNGVLAWWERSISFSEWYGFWGMVVLLSWQQIGYLMVIYVAGIQGISDEVIEAARVDGANNRQIVRRVMLPLLMPSITVCTFLTVTNGFKMFDQNLALTNGAPSRLSELLALNIYNTFYGRPGFEGVGQAKAVVFFVIVAAIAIIQNRLTTAKEVKA
ncbi:sugar ABC transporter permease [Demequina capsici]|uniref:Sugar ABC transporter permease n=1 Tax=Demequina capsici TaxID=3075620 RepID=A0AA96JH06_9MICO|nr:MULTISPECIES: sugar ABC transporter permease [unclassified Demequina]WNM25623.1 sugar ABC transporter permease [Demequina sp. OYTSA14]WNM28529.1 sugar ABC transporter permease [Demequina sp. PMTSA13]